MWLEKGNLAHLNYETTLKHEVDGHVGYIGTLNDSLSF